jgi:hypothetical protein
LPPPQTPAAVVPQVPPAPPAPEGVGQVVLDTEGGPAEARVVTVHWAMVNRYGSVTAGGSLSDRLCTTPCVASLPYGTHSLEFIGVADNERAGTASVVFAQSPSVYRYALGLQRSKPPGKYVVAHECL